MWQPSSARVAKDVSDEDKNTEHRQRVAQMLRYISSMALQSTATTGTAGGLEHEFVRRWQPTNGGGAPPSFFNDGKFDTHHDDGDSHWGMGRVLFSLEDFSRMNALCIRDDDADADAISSRLPFSLYMPNGTAGRKRLADGRPKESMSTSTSPCWLRITRATGATLPSQQDSSVLQYLEDWSSQVGNTRPISKWIRRMDEQDWHRAPPTNKGAVKRFVKLLRQYQSQQKIQRILEPIYNGLFEWYQGAEGGDGPHQRLELYWGLGQAKMILSSQESDSDGSANTASILDGPLLQIRVEVELARDGALLVRPKQHSGVTLHREVLSTFSLSDVKARQLHQLVQSLDVSDLSPGAPSTYIPTLKRLAVELSAGEPFKQARLALISLHLAS